ncbi:unnamed protein product [Arctia plantaginis]|uniref:Uncharacterized protein n=1 Tax=Arctia plantaginis TaxID=874455 RepID=A0A8S1AA27_ARCPL|nr:unnamed protein product [Arctia plantaginis]
MAVTVSMTLGMTGSIVGSTMAGYMIKDACEPMFYTFGGLLIQRLVRGQFTALNVPDLRAIAQKAAGASSNAHV